MGSHTSKPNPTTTSKTYNVSLSLPTKSALHTHRSNMSDDSRRVSFSVDSDIGAHSLERRKSIEVSAKKMVDVFYDRIQHHPLLARFFEGIDINTLKRKQEILMQLAFGGVDSFDDDFPNVALLHVHLMKEKELSVIHLDAFIAEFLRTMEDLRIPLATQTNVADTLKFARKGFVEQITLIEQQK